MHHVSEACLQLIGDHCGCCCSRGSPIGCDFDVSDWYQLVLISIESLFLQCSMSVELRFDRDFYCSYISSLAYSMRKMMMDRALARIHIASSLIVLLSYACHCSLTVKTTGSQAFSLWNYGSVTTIFSDKTGTLTLNQVNFPSFI